MASFGHLLVSNHIIVIMNLIMNATQFDIPLVQKMCILNCYFFVSCGICLNISTARLCVQLSIFP